MASATASAVRARPMRVCRRRSASGRVVLMRPSRVRPRLAIRPQPGAMGSGGGAVKLESGVPPEHAPLRPPSNGRRLLPFRNCDELGVGCCAAGGAGAAVGVRVVVGRVVGAAAGVTVATGNRRDQGADPGSDHELGRVSGDGAADRGCRSKREEARRGEPSKHPHVSRKTLSAGDGDDEGGLGGGAP